MKSAKCPECGFVGWADAEFCKKCGASVMADSAYVPEQTAVGQTYDYQYQPPAFQPQLKQGLAVTSLVIGILNFLFLGIFGITIIAGIIISVVALKKIKRYPFQYGGRSLAVAGLVTNIVSVVVLIPVLLIAAIAVPNLLAARRAANEGSAMASLRKIHSAQMTYQATRGRGQYGTMADLQRESLIPDELAGGTRHGYRFKIDVVGDRGDGWPGFAAVGVPTEYGSTGRRSFFVDETGVLRGTDSQGMDATTHDPPLNFERNYPSDRSATRRSQPTTDY